MCLFFGWIGVENGLRFLHTTDLEREQEGWAGGTSHSVLVFVGVCVGVGVCVCVCVNFQ